MTTIIITEKTSQKKDLANAIGTQYGEIYPAEGHLLSLQEPQKVNGAWSKWSFDLLKPDDFYPTCPAPDGSPSAKNKLAAIENALKKASKVILATDCDREGQLIGEELLRHYKFKGTVERAMFTAQDEKTLRDAFKNLEPNEKYTNLGQAALVRQQADQVYNLSLTRAATVALKEPGQYGAIGIGRVKTPTLAIVCIRELEILDFEKSDFYHVVATTTTEAGVLELKHAPKEKILDPEIAENIRSAAQGFEGPLSAEMKVKSTKPPKLLDLPELQKICSRKWGWTANKTLEVAQELYDGNGKKIQTYPRAESRYLAENQIEDVPLIIQGLNRLDQYKDIDLAKPEIRMGKAGHFSDDALKGVSHHAIVPNKNTMDRIHSIYPRLSEDEKKMFDLVASSYLAILMPDYVYESTSIAISVPIPNDKPIEFKITGNIPKELGWKSVYTDVMEKKEEDAGELPPVKDGDLAKLDPVTVEIKKTKPPSRFSEGSLIDAMQNAWRFVDDKAIQERLKEAKGIGTPATRASIIAGLKMQSFLSQKGKHIVPTEAGLTLFKTLKATAPELVDPGVTALWEMKLDDVLLGNQSARQVWDEIGEATQRLIEVIRDNAEKAPKIVTGVKAPKGAKSFGGGKPTDKMKTVAKSIAENKGVALPKGYTTDFQVCRDFLDEHLGGKPVDPLIALERRLASGIITGINETSAKEIVQTFGLDALQIIEETPERLSEIKGLSAAKVKVICEGLLQKTACAKIASYLNDCHISPTHALRVFKTYGDETLTILKEKPYQTVRDVKSFGFENADHLAHKIALPPDSLPRAQAALFHALNQSSGPRPMASIMSMLENRLGISTETLQNALSQEIQDKTIFQDGDMLNLVDIHKADQTIAKRLKALNQGPTPWPPIDADKALPWIEGKLSISLNVQQRKAVAHVISSKMTCLNIAPGVEVDLIFKAIGNILLAKKVPYKICCPTRQSAKILATQTGLDTVHIAKLLDWNAKTAKFKHSSKKPIEAQLLILCDAHLFDRKLFSQILEATPKETALLLMNDWHETAPVSSGDVMGKILKSSGLPSLSLDVVSEIARQSLRIQNLHSLRQNKPYQTAEGECDFYKISATSTPDHMRKLIEVVKNRLPKRFKFDAIKDIQIVCQNIAGELGSNALNKHLQSTLNPATSNLFVERFGTLYRTGDKVMLNECDLNRELYACETGIVKSIDPISQTISITFEGRSLEFDFDELDHFSLAYALPLSKAHFAQTKAVVVSLEGNDADHNVIYNALLKSSNLAIVIEKTS